MNWRRTPWLKKSARDAEVVLSVCFGDFAMADLLQPGITVVDHSAEAVGAAAAARLAERIAQPDLPASIARARAGGSQNGSHGTAAASDRRCARRCRVPAGPWCPP